MKRNKAFTLIELVSVLVILAILALIVTPLVLNIIRKARTAADKRSIDAYGRSIELAIADYLLDNGTFPTSIDQLTIEYSGDRVVCSTTQLNSDSSVYLAGCTVNSRAVTGYAYGKEEVVTYEAYEIGDEVRYNNVDYYVIKTSGANESTVTLLKSTPLTVAEVNQYGAGHINRYTQDSQGTAYDQNGYGGMAYYSSETCGYDNNDSWHDSGCTSDYDQSDIKYVVDAWASAKVPSGLEEARLITVRDLMENLGYELQDECTGSCYPIGKKTEITPEWLWDSNYRYWTMTPYDDSVSGVWVMGEDGKLFDYGNNIINKNTVRPVITLSKSVLNN